MQSKTDQLRKTENTISDDAKAKLQADIATLQRNLQRDSQDAQQDLQEEQQRILGSLSQKMQQVMNKYAVDHQLTMIMDVSGQPSNILFASNTIDITRDIITLYDAANAVTPSEAPAKAPAAAAPAPAPKKPATPPPAAPTAH
jgi:outer membrane protein